MLRLATPGGEVARRFLHRIAHYKKLSPFVVLLLPACGGSETTMVDLNDRTPDLSTAEIHVVSGDQQEGEVGSPLAGPMVVEVRDPAGRPLADVPLEWSFTNGAGMAEGDAPAKVLRVQTDESGRSEARWQLDTIAGTQEASVRIVVPESETSGEGSAAQVSFRFRALFRAIARAAAAAQLTVSPESVQLAAGETRQLSAVVADRYGNVLQGVGVQWSSSDTTVARASGSGLVRGVGGGSAWIHARYAFATGRSGVTVVEENEPPTASISSPGSNVTIAAGDSVDFRGSASDSDGQVVTHAWDFGDGRTANVEDPRWRRFDNAGTYTVTYRVTDDDGAQSPTRQRTITVESPDNEAPTASISSPSSNVTITAGDSVDFRGSASDSDGQVVTHAWNFGDGRTASVQSPRWRTFNSAGTFTVTYRVTDDDGAQSSTASRTVTVRNSSPNPNPGSLLWESDWSAGNWSDGGKWDDQSAWVTDALPQRGAIVTQDSGAPTQNVLSVVVSNDANSWIQMAPTSPPSPPAVGEAITWRWYQKVLLPNSWNADELTHGIGLGAMTVPTNFAVINVYTTTQGTWRIEVLPNDSNGPFATGTSWPTRVHEFRKGEWYRFEWTMHRIGTSQWRTEIHAYDMQNNLIVETSDFTDWPFGGNRNLEDHTFSGSATSSTRFVGFLNGLAGLNQQVEWARFAGIAAVKGTSVGPYDPARGW